jgi:hypothetical protein
MRSRDSSVVLVGDNPFHGISHLSQERARTRSKAANSSKEATKVVRTSLENGADGFMFSVSDLTLSILETMKEQKKPDSVELYAIVPYAFEYVRIATQTGTPGLVKRFAKQIAVSGNIKAIMTGLKAVLTMEPESLLDVYLAYELSRIKSSAGKHAKLVSLLLHEVVTDMALGLGFDWLFESYVDRLLRLGITPGFNTRNFPYLMHKLEAWGIDTRKILVATPFNKAGFQMNPSREECERALECLSSPIVLAISVLAAGYLKPSTAVEYIADLHGLKGVVIGVSTEQQAIDTFRLFKSRLKEPSTRYDFLERAPTV